MKHKKTILAFLLILGLLVFSGCATGGRILDNRDVTPKSTTPRNGTMAPDNITNRNDGLGGAGINNGAGGMGDQNTNDRGIMDNDFNRNTNNLNQ